MAEKEKSIWDALVNAGLEGFVGGGPQAQAASPLSNQSVQMLQQAQPQSPLMNLDPAAFDAEPAANVPQRAPEPQPVEQQGFGQASPAVNFSRQTPVSLNTGGPTELQQEQAEQLRALVEQQNAPVSSFRDVDLGPLAALVDDATGSKLAPSISGNVNVNKRRKEIEALRKSLAGGKAQSTQDRRDARFLKSQQLRGNNLMRKDKNKLVGSLGQIKNTFANLEDAISSGDFVLLQNSLSNYARAISGEKGVLTDRDIVRVLPNSMELSLKKAEFWMTGNPGKALPENITRSLRKGIEISRRNLHSVSQEQFDNLLGDSEFVGASPEFANKMRSDTGRFLGDLKTGGRGRGAKSPKRAPKSGAPKVGSTSGGFRFRGGDPADKNNWERL